MKNALVLMAIAVSGFLASAQNPPAAPPPVPPPAPVVSAPVQVTPAAPAAPAPEAPAAPAAADHAPKIVCDQPNHDFGRASSTQSVTHAYTIRNTGDLTLEIKGVRASCGCTAAAAAQTSVPPNGETQINATLNLAGRTGRQMKTITIDSNDPKQPVMVLTLQGEVSEAINVLPDRLMFGMVKPLSMVTSAVEITSGDQQPFHLQGVECSATQFTATAVAVEDGKRYRLTAATTVPLTEGVINATITVRTDHPQRPVLQIPLYVQVIGAQIMTIPARVDLDLASPGPVSRAVILFSTHNETFTVDSVQAPEGVVAQALPWGQRGFRIQLDNVVPSAALSGKTITAVISLGPENKKQTVSVPIYVANIPVTPPPP